MKVVQIYINSVIELANSLIFKSEVQARAMNKPLTELGIRIPSDKREWRYYQHISGKKFDGDVPVLLESLDDGTEIELTIEALAHHKKTSNVYRYNREFIEELISNYPDMCIYIKGCFYPISIERAIDVPDCTILWHDDSLVEPQEVSLFRRLSEWMRSVHIAWFAESWEITQDAFTLAFWEQLYPAIPAKILEIRLALTHTPETHSHHIELFLSSHQKTHEYLPYLTLRQKQSLYRNIRYFERNSGKEYVLEWLIDDFLTGWNMRTVTYDVSAAKHDPSTGEVAPKPIAIRRALNFKEEEQGRDAEVVPTEALIQKEFGLAYDNPNNSDEYLESLNFKLGLTQYPEQTTKLIEVTAVDPNGLEEFYLEDVLVNEWLHNASTGRYAAYHEILNPLTGDTLRMSTCELFALFMYASAKGYSGTELNKLDSFIAIGVQNKNWVSTEDYHGMLRDSWPERWNPIVDFYTDSFYDIYSSIVTPDELYITATEILKFKRQRQLFTYNRLRTDDIAAAELCFRHSYIEVDCDLNLPEDNYHDFFQRFGISYDDISSEAWQDIAKDAFNTATAYDRNSQISHQEIQRAMVGLLTRLSSYTIHFAQQMAVERNTISEPLFSTIGDTPVRAEGTVVVENQTHAPSNFITESYGTVEAPELFVDILTYDAPTEYEYEFDHTVGCSVIVEHAVNINVNVPTTDIERVS